jgi:hypothetical protein
MVAVAMVATSVNAQPGGSKSNLLFANASIPADARCELKSGIIKYEAVTQGIKVETTSYFDDYGKKQAAVAVVNQGLVQTETKTLQFEDTIYQINVGMKMGQKVVSPEKPINYLQLTPDVIEKYKIQELGTETVAGRQCTRYSEQTSQMGQTVNVEVWVWKGIALKTVMKLGDTEIVSQTATEIQENPTIDPEMFEIPEGVTMM